MRNIVLAVTVAALSIGPAAAPRQAPTEKPMKLALIGVVIGLVMSFTLTRALTSLLYGVTNARVHIRKGTSVLAGVADRASETIAAYKQIGAG